MAKKDDGSGHNALDFDKAGDIVADLLKAFDVMEAENAAHMEKIKGLYDAAASKTGMTKRLFQREFKRLRRKQKEIGEEIEMAEHERREITEFRDALQGTPFGKFAADKLAKVIG